MKESFWGTENRRTRALPTEETWYSLTIPIALVVVLAGIILLIVRPAAAREREEEELSDQARLEFRFGIQQYDAGRYEEALERFEAAYSIRASYRIQYNIGQVQMQMGRPHLALEAFHAYLRNGGDEIDLERRRAVLEEIERAEKVVARIRVEGSTGGIAWIDDRPVGTIPMTHSIWINEGFRHLSIHMNGVPVCERTIELVAGGVYVESCDDLRGYDSDTETTIRSLSSGRFGQNRSSDSTAGQKLLRVAPWVMVGLSSATLIAGTVAASKARSLNRQLNDACPSGICAATWSDEIETLPRWAGAADGLLVTSALLASGAVVLFLVQRRREVLRSDTESSRVAFGPAGLTW